MSIFASTWEIQNNLGRTWARSGEDGASNEEHSVADQYSCTSSSSNLSSGSPEEKPSFLEGMLSSGGTTRAAEGGEGDVSKYWQNYDLSVSEAPKLFSDAEFEAVKRIEAGLKVLVLRKRLQERVTARNREREVRAVVRVQAVVRGIATRASLPALQEQHAIRVRVKKQYKLFKRELRSEGFAIQLYRTKDGALRRVVLKPDGKLTSLCWGGFAKVKSGSVPLIALKSCYSGYPKHDFPTKSMLARATPLPERSKTFTIQVDTGRVHVFVAAEDILKKLVKGLQSIIAEISSPDSFYFDGTGVLRRVTSSIFDDRGNVAQREAAKKERQARFRSRQVEAEARLASLGLKGGGEGQTARHDQTPATLRRFGVQGTGDGQGNASRANDQWNLGNTATKCGESNSLKTPRSRRPGVVEVAQGGGEKLDGGRA